MSGVGGELHELSAGYALDALDEHERSIFEEHLLECESCVDDVRSFRAASSVLAYATAAAAPPPELKDRILERARREQPVPSVVVLRPKRALRALAAVAAVAAAAALGFGIWAATLSSSLDSEQAARRADARATAILTDAAARRLDFGRSGYVAFVPSGEAVMVVQGLAPAPQGKTYEAWVISAGVPERAGLFPGGRPQIVLLGRRITEGAKVAVTLEPEGGVDQPTGRILFGSGRA